jgi:hypothetical protein
MNIRRLVLPAALVAGLGFACASEAQASPVPSARVTSANFGGVRVGGGVGVGFPIGGHYYSAYQPGYWTTQTVQVLVPVQVPMQVQDRIIGTDINGNPIWSYRTVMQTQMQPQWVTQQVWVPGHYHGRYLQPRGHVGLGIRFR